jgi:hypothetical protein
MLKKTFCAIVLMLTAAALISELSLLSTESQVFILFIYFLAGLGVGLMGYLEGVYPGHRAFLLIFAFPMIIVHSWQEWFMKGSAAYYFANKRYKPQFQIFGGENLKGHGRTLDINKDSQVAENTFKPWYMK